PGLPWAPEGGGDIAGRLGCTRLRSSCVAKRRSARTAARRLGRSRGLSVGRAGGSRSNRVAGAELGADGNKVMLRRRDGHTPLRGACGAPIVLAVSGAAARTHTAFTVVSSVNYFMPACCADPGRCLDP